MHAIVAGGVEVHAWRLAQFVVVAFEWLVRGYSAPYSADDVAAAVSDVSGLDQLAFAGVLGFDLAHVLGLRPSAVAVLDLHAPQCA